MEKKRDTPNTSPALTKKIGKTTYEVHVKFSEKANENLTDKMKRVLKNHLTE